MHGLWVLLSALVLWLGAFILGLSPILYASSPGFKVNILAMLKHVHSDHYKDLSIFAVAVVFASVAEAFETALRTQHGSLAGFFAVIIAVTLLSAGAFLAYNLGPILDNSVACDKFAMLAYPCILMICFLGKILSELV
jgi:hypothetical protein